MSVAAQLVVAIVAAKDRQDTVGATVTALLPLVDRVLVVDDGSGDNTAQVAAAAGAEVLVLAYNLGKGGAVTAGVEAEPDADVYLLVDADTGRTAANTARLLTPVRNGELDMTIGVLPGAGRSGGFGVVKRIAAAGIGRAGKFRAVAPLSGQRAVKGELLRQLIPLAPRFGLETALTIDACRAGALVAEIDVAMAHRATGRSVAGFGHRAGQGADIARALWPRITTAKQRIALIIAAFLFVAAFGLWSGGRSEPASVAIDRTWSKVVLFDMPGLLWSDVGSARLPNYDRLLAKGAVAATTVRTLGKKPSVTEGWATLGAGTRVVADERAGVVLGATTSFENGIARQAAARRVGDMPRGELVNLGAGAIAELNRGRHLSSQPGALGDALHAAGKRTAVVGNGDNGVPSTVGGVARPAALGVMDRLGSVDTGTVEPTLVGPAPDAAYGVMADPAAMVAAFDRAAASADVIAVDSGDLHRAIHAAGSSTPEAAAAARAQALQSTDRLLGEIADRLPVDTLLLVVSVAPSTTGWRLQPTLAVGPGVPHGQLHSPSVRRAGIIAITDLAPTVLGAVGAEPGDGMVGHALRFRPGGTHLAALADVDRDSRYRESFWYPVTVGYIIVQSALYILASALLYRPGGVKLGRYRRSLEWALLMIAGLPLASFIFRGIPDVAALGPPGLLVMGLIDMAIVAVASRFRRHPLSPLGWVLGATVAVLCVDILTGARLQIGSLLGYSLHTAGRFTGIGNTAFAALAATSLLVGALHVHFAPRRREAVVFVGCLFALVALIDGAPSLGDDVGGILTLVPAFALALLAFAGQRLRFRTVASAGVLTVAAVALATVVDVLRPPVERTHLGRFAASVFRSGSSEFRTTVARKLASNLRTYSSVWSWLIVIIALLLVYLLVWRRGWTRLLPMGSALRIAVVATLGVSIIGNLLNDSGVVVTALVFVFLGPFLTLLALREDSLTPVRLASAVPVVPEAAVVPGPAPELEAVLELEHEPVPGLDPVPELDPVAGAEADAGAEPEQAPAPAPVPARTRKPRAPRTKVPPS